ncbi:nSTAND3 domain-containing NTPase, partial [Rhodopirellula baltica]|uniref:nSTAND3 domain-containing NTPase n=1 Tax=Rhodopirellula baltica TaxID=265606 RepID=UPI0005654EEA
MGGREGGRGYLVQTLIALLGAVKDPDWTEISVEPDSLGEKVDVVWHYVDATKVVQVKSSQRQIGLADTKSWANELRESVSATEYVLTLVGPCSESVAKLGRYLNVDIPAPKPMDMNSLLAEAAHLLDRHLSAIGFTRFTPDQREMIIGAMASKLAELSAVSGRMTRADFNSLLEGWLGEYRLPDSRLWSRVKFDRQRDLTSALAGKRLGPNDVDACPRLSLCDVVIDELERSHSYTIVGTPGCGKSMTLWHVAKSLSDKGFTVWRLSEGADWESALEQVPTAKPSLLAIDDAHLAPEPFRDRLVEQSCNEMKTLFATTIDDSLREEAICIDPLASMRELKQAMLQRRDEVIPCIQKYDDRVGDRSSDISFEDRIGHAADQKTPWYFFWVLRGGWSTARREYQSLEQFGMAKRVIEAVACFQNVTCDAGVSLERLKEWASSVGVTYQDLEAAIERLAKLNLVIVDETIRTKHIAYANELLCFAMSGREKDRWPAILEMFSDAMLDTRNSLKGVHWLRGTMTATDFGIGWKDRLDERIRESLIERCLDETEDFGWAAACYGGVVDYFEQDSHAREQQKETIKRWIDDGDEIAIHFCSQIFNSLINESNFKKHQDRRVEICKFAAALNVDRLVERANVLGIDGFASFGFLLNRLAFFDPPWVQAFLNAVDWPRIAAIANSADAKEAYSVNEIVMGFASLSEKFDSERALSYVLSAKGFVARAINERPSRAMLSMDDIFWSCLGYPPKMFRRGKQPTKEQADAARCCLEGVRPEPFARAIENATPSQMESLAKTISAIRELRPEFGKSIVEQLDESLFLSNSQSAWRRQCEELLRLLVVLSNPHDDFGPCRSWIVKAEDLINGPLLPELILLSPETAIRFFDSGKPLRLIGKFQTRWNITGLAIWQLHCADERKSVDIVRAHLESLVNAVCKLTLDEPQHVLRFFRLL